MLTSSPSKKVGARGFTLIEVMVATAVLTIGMVSVAALATTMLATGKRSKYMALASSLASEKLEDLSRYAATNPAVCVPTGSTSVGSLTTDILQTTNCPDGINSDSTPYDDDVDISFGNSSSDCPSTGGCFAETISAVSNGTTQYWTTYHSPDGHISTPAASSTASTQQMTFHRRWLIEADTPVAGVRRVTVIVTLANKTVTPTVTFQMSTVRP
jgi:prepilin-type N-terminal cleavage/methylation domain-containing protein